MNNIKLTMAFAFIISSCAGPLQVNSDYSVEGRFYDYQTFHFLNDKNKPDKSTNPIIERTIYQRLDALGFNYDPLQADLLISYNVYQDATTIPGFEQPKMNLWQFHADNSYEEESSTVRRNYHLKKGVVHISFFDSASAKTVWQGYASGLKTEAQLQALVFRIMDEYKSIYRDQLALAK